MEAEAFAENEHVRYFVGTDIRYAPLLARLVHVAQEQGVLKGADASFIRVPSSEVARRYNLITLHLHGVFGSAPPAVKTSISANAPIEQGRALFIRGEGPDLCWSKGVRMRNEGGTWKWETKDAFMPFPYKLLVDDIAWSEGENYSADAGGENTVSPTFEKMPSQQETMASFVAAADSDAFSMDDLVMRMECDRLLNVFCIKELAGNRNPRVRIAAITVLGHVSWLLLLV